MTARLQGTLLALVLGVAGLDLVWAAAGHFRLDHGAYLGVTLLCLALLAGGIFYQRHRPEPRLAAMFFASAFLCGFSAAAAVLNYLLLSVAGPRIDLPLAALDRALGFSWPAMMAAMAAHPVLNAIFLLAYNAMLPQVALLAIALAGQGAAVYRFCLAIAVGALSCIAIWSLHPSFGAFSVYAPPAHLALALDADYARSLVELLRKGPGLITPADIKGLIGFPSYHAVLALLAVYYAWPLRRLRWPMLALNILVLAATPVQGGHHLVDVLAAFPVALLALGIAQTRFSPKNPRLVKKTAILTVQSYPGT